jgi:ADP-ribose pyrophosphatase YjhB (NUDIX family)
MNQILLIRREKDPCKGMLCFPGGRVEVNEDYKTATEREIEEETGKEILNYKINKIIIIFLCTIYISYE